MYAKAAFFAVLALLVSFLVGACRAHWAFWPVLTAYGLCCGASGRATAVVVGDVKGEPVCAICGRVVKDPVPDGPAETVCSECWETKNRV